MSSHTCLLHPLFHYSMPPERHYVKWKDTKHLHSTLCLHARTNNGAIIIPAAGWFDDDASGVSVVVRRVRLVSLGASETKFCPSDATVHVLDVLTLRLQVIGGVVRAWHKYLAKSKNWSWWAQPPLLVFNPSNFSLKQDSFSLPGSFSHRRLERAGDGRKQIWVVTESIH